MLMTALAAVSSVFQPPIRVACCILLLCCTSVPGQEKRSDSAGKDTTELAALKVLNDSDWAHTVKPSLQDTPCTYENPAFPDLYPKEKAAAIEAVSPVLPTDPVVADGSEYLVRFQSAKPVQTAVKELLALGDKWPAYGRERLRVSEEDGPTDLPNLRYNIADMINIALILKRSGPVGTTLFNYGYADGGLRFPLRSFRVWPCAGLRTQNGEVYAHVSMPILKSCNSRFRA